ncbi:hypothetical protein Tco_0936418 [Tanacetum coccineum]
MDDGSLVVVAMDEGHRVDKGLSVNEYLVRPEDEGKALLDQNHHTSSLSPLNTHQPNIRKKMKKGKSGFNESRKRGHKKVQQQKPLGGLSNRQEEYKKAMPLAAKRLKIQKRKHPKKMKQRRAWKLDPE